MTILRYKSWYTPFLDPFLDPLFETLLALFELFLGLFGSKTVILGVMPKTAPPNGRFWAKMVIFRLIPRLNRQKGGPKKGQNVKNDRSPLKTLF